MEDPLFGLCTRFYSFGASFSHFLPISLFEVFSSETFSSRNPFPSENFFPQEHIYPFSGGRKYVCPSLLCLTSPPVFIHLVPPYSPFCRSIFIKFPSLLFLAPFYWSILPWRSDHSLLPLFHCWQSALHSELIGPNLVGFVRFFYIQIRRMQS